MKRLLLLIFSLQLLGKVDGQFTHNGDLDIHYTINARLQNESKSIDGDVLYKITNHSKHPIDTLVIHLWMNAFKDNNSSYGKQLLANHDYSFYFRDGKHKIGYRELTFQYQNQRIEYSAQSDEIIKVPLAKPLLPQQHIELKASYKLTLPKLISRVGYDDEIIQLIHWYPQVALHKNGKWHPCNYLSHGELIYPFARYDIDLALDKEMYISYKEDGQFNNRMSLSTGELLEIPILIYNEKVINNSTKRKDLIINTTYYRDTAIWSKVLDITNEVIDFYDEKIGKFPFNNLHVVQGPKKAYSAMEYPGLIILNGSMDSEELRYYIAHEIAHQYFYASLAFDQRHEAFMDEGLATFYTGAYMKFATGSYYYNRKYQLLSSDRSESFFFNHLHTHLCFRHLNQPFDVLPEHISSINYGLNSYPFAASIIKEAYEKDTSLFDRTMNSFFETYKDQHISHQELTEYFASNKVDLNFFKNVDKETADENQKTSHIKLRLFPKLDNEPAVHITPFPILNGVERWSPALAFYSNPLSRTRLNFEGYLGYSPTTKTLISNTNIYYDLFRGEKPSFYRLGLNHRNHQFFNNQRDNYTLGYRTYGMYAQYHNISGKLPSDPFSQFDVSISLINEDFARFEGPGIFGLSTDRFLSLRSSYSYYDNKPVFPTIYKVSLASIPQYNQNDHFLRLEASVQKKFFLSSKKYLSLRVWGGGYVLNTKRNSYSFNNTIARGSLGLMTTGVNDYDYSYVQLWRSNQDPIQLGPQQGGLRVGLPANLNIGQTNHIAGAINVTYRILEKFPLAMFFDIGGYRSTEDSATQYLYAAGITLPLIKKGIEINIPLLVSKDIRSQSRSLFSLISFRLDMNSLSPRGYLDNPNRLLSN